MKISGCRILLTDYFTKYLPKLNNEYIGLSVKLFNSFTPIPIDIPNEADFDILYNNDCNGFKGFNFSATTIPANRQITDLIISIILSSIVLIKLLTIQFRHFGITRNYFFQI
jgi:hypothetical protein